MGRRDGAPTQCPPPQPRSPRSALPPSLAAAGFAAAAFAAAPGAAAEPAPPPASSEAGGADVYALPATPPPLPSTPVTLLQYEVCPFCCKVKAVLDYYRVPYVAVEVSPLTKRQLKAAAPGAKKVPVALIDGDTLADSSAIISRIAASARAAGRGPAPPRARGWLRGGRGAAAADADKEAAWRRWVDGRLVKVVTVNIYRTGREAWQTFDYITEAGDFGGALEKAASRVVGAGMMWAIAGRLAKRYGVDGEARDALAAAAAEWVSGALDGAPFAGGASPDLADLSAFGVWRAVRGTDTFGDAMGGSAALREWYARVEAAVGPGARVDA